MTTRIWLPRISVACALACGSAAMGQIEPQREYYGIDRPVPMTVRVPAGLEGEARIDLYHAGTPEPVSSAPVIAGGVNMASLFPSLWRDKSPKVSYAQLRVGATPVGPPVVLTPLINPPLPMLFDTTAGKPYFVDPTTNKPSDADPKRSTVVFTPDEAPCYAGVRAEVDKLAVVETSAGSITFRMRPDQAPHTVQNFLDLARGGFFTDIIIHRVVARTKTGDPFVVQFGDPTGSGDGGPGYNIDLEASKLQHDFGVLSMARNTDPNTNGSQVFICLSREGTARLDGKYCAFAQAIAGADVILALAETPCRPGTDRPENPPVVQQVRLVDAPPYGTGPGPVTRPAAGSVGPR